MFVDARTLSEGQSLEADLCIIGAGAAGITIARELAGRDIRVALVESGDMAPDGATQALANGDNVGLPYFPLMATRLRMFGGTTNHWSGFCRPMDPLDFEARDWIPHSGWPFGREYLDPFYERAHKVLKLGPYRYDVRSFVSPKAQALEFQSDRAHNVIFLHNPLRFREVYKDDIEKAKNITTYLNANVEEIETSATGDQVTQLRIACMSGKKLTLTAKTFVLATGAIENARVLLASRSVQTAGLGNQNDLVGRYFMEHPHFESGLFLPVEKFLPLPLYDAHWSSKGVPFATFALSEDTLRAEKLCAMNFALTPLVVGNPKSDKYLKREVQDAEPAVDALKAMAALTAAKHFPDTAVKFYSIYNRLEQVPNPDSRVVLSDKKDSLGLQLSNLDWKLTALERHSLRRGQQILAEEIARAGLGRVRIDLADGDDTWPKVPQGGFHHMGTTRMHEDPKQGVTDSKCRVHGVANLYIAGSSLFPACGYSNPTLTLTALALRLADHLKESLA